MRTRAKPGAAGRGSPHPGPRVGVLTPQGLLAHARPLPQVYRHVVSAGGWIVGRRPVCGDGAPCAERASPAARAAGAPSQDAAERDQAGSPRVVGAVEGSCLLSNGPVDLRICRGTLGDLRICRGTPWVPWVVLLLGGSSVAARLAAASLPPVSSRVCVPVAGCATLVLSLQCCVLCIQHIDESFFFFCLLFSFLNAACSRLVSLVVACYMSCVVLDSDK